jgi:hypothetical protein
VPKKNTKLPPEVVDHWPEIFSDIEIKAIPIQYIKSINVQFADGKVWVIEVNNKIITQTNLESVEESLVDFFEEYDDVIDTVDFNLNTAKVRKDIETRTKRFMKKRK